MDWCRSVLFGKNKNEKKIMLFYTFLYMCVCACARAFIYFFKKFNWKGSYLKKTQRYPWILKNSLQKKMQGEKTGGINFQTVVLQVPENICKGD